MSEEYHNALHAMQSGVATEIAIDSKSIEPKHLRVGVNAAMCDNAGLVKLLIEKGIITEAEHLEAITKEMQREVERYETRLSERLGRQVKLL